MADSDDEESNNISESTEKTSQNLKLQPKAFKESNHNFKKDGRFTSMVDAKWKLVSAVAS